MYAYGAASVKCAVCNTVTPVNQSTMTELPNQHGASTSNSGSGAGSSRPQQTVVIVNPPTLDAEGNEVRMQVLPLYPLFLYMFFDRHWTCSVLSMYMVPFESCCFCMA